MAATTRAAERSTRLPALRRFAIAITVLNLFGHTLFGFEQSWAQLFAALATAYAFEILTELLTAWGQDRRPRFGEGRFGFVDFLLSAHITGLAVAMLIYTNDQIWPIVFGVALAMASKVVIRAPMPGGGSRHFLNPSNLAVTATLLAFPWVSIAPPYHFTENLPAWGHWLVPGIIVCTGSFLNARLTHRVPLILAWVGGFALQGILRSVLLNEMPITAAFMPMTSVAFVLFTFYMVTDPATTPSGTRGQVAFGLGVAGVYGALAMVHTWLVVFFPLTFVCLVRGLYLIACQRYPRLATLHRPLPIPGVQSSGVPMVAR